MNLEFDLGRGTRDTNENRIYHIRLGWVVSIEEISFLMDSVFQYLETLKENDHVPVEFHVNLWEHCLIVKRYVVNLLFMP